MGAGGIDTPENRLSTSGHQELVDGEANSLLRKCGEDPSEARCAPSPSMTEPLLSHAHSITAQHALL